ncbi:MAG: inositol 2-dehydrogenase [Actinomycetia bacterium]|nr:inositol 2-dehydrogenase [Actinomycetes bacterium]MCP4960097.1 inositol 2-dehydrogenase [Actinomycetes bacterium]
MHADLIERQVAGATTSCVYDVYAQGSAEVAADVGARVAASPDDLIGADDVDAVAICSSTDTHIDLLVAAARAGKPVFIEKPLSLDLAEVDRGLAAVREAGIAVQVGFNRRFDASHKAVHDAVASGDVGDVQMVRITSRDPAPPPIEYIKVSGGIFCDMTIHDFDMARYVTGSEVAEVYAKGDVMVDPAIGEAGDLDTVVIVMTHKNGAITTIDNSRQAVYGYDQRVEVFGSGGMAMSDNPGVNTTITRTAAGSTGSIIPYFFLERYVPSYLAEWSEFVGMVRDGAPSPVTIDDGRAPLVIGLAAWKSVREGRPVLTEEIS